VLAQMVGNLLTVLWKQQLLKIIAWFGVGPNLCFMLNLVLSIQNGDKRNEMLTIIEEMHAIRKFSLESFNFPPFILQSFEIFIKPSHSFKLIARKIDCFQHTRV
jgi:hypothetical protein